MTGCALTRQAAVACTSGRRSPAPQAPRGVAAPAQGGRRKRGATARRQATITSVGMPTTVKVDPKLSASKKMQR